MALKVYDSDQVTVTIGGALMQGYADGEFLRVENESDAFADVVGTDGEVSRSKTNDNRATITILLMQTSSSNAVLSALHNLDKLRPNGAGVGPLLIRDQQGTSLYTAAACWIQKAPDVSFDREATTREWVLRCDKLVHFTGGN